MLLLKTLIACSMFTIFYMLFKGEKYEHINSEVLKLFENKFNEYQINQIKSSNQYIKKKKNKIIEKIDELIKNAQVNEVIPFLNGITFLIASTLFGGFGYILISSVAKNNIPLRIEGIFAGAITPYLILNKLSTYIENQIDEDIESFISSGKAYAKTNNNLIYILENSIDDMSGPIKRIIIRLLSDLKGGTTPEVAFENSINRIQNIRFKEVLSDLLTARIEQGNYVQVFNNAEKVYDNYFNIKQKTISEMAKVRKGVRVLLISILAACLFCAKAFTGAKEALTSTLPGHLIIAYFVAIFILNIFFDIETERFNY